MRAGAMAVIVALLGTEPAVEVHETTTSGIQPAVAGPAPAEPELSSETPGVDGATNAEDGRGSTDEPPSTPAPTYAVEGSGGVASAPAVEDPADDYTPDPEHRRLQVGGAVAVGLGCGAFIAMVAGLAVASGAGDELDLERQREPSDIDRIDDLEQRQRIGRGLAIAGGSVAGVLIIAGVATMAVGYKRARLDYEQHLERNAARKTRVELAGGPGELGGALRLRF